jgi:hypothetical protein
MVRYNGYIEGYYGRMLSWDERAGILDTLRALRLNAYLCAPKEDPYHRHQWKTPYPAAWLRAFARFAAAGRRAGVLLIPAVAPGLSFDYRSAGDFRLLIDKCMTLARCGARTIALLMDDIPSALPPNCRTSFRSLGQAHGALLACLREELSRRAPGTNLWFCPTIYADQIAQADPDARGYLDDLAESMPRDIPLLWTGPRVISPAISARAIRTVTRLFGRRIILWDNLYANDYCPTRLFVGPYAGRSADLRNATQGILLNPTGLPATDAFLLSLLAGFVKGKSSAATWRTAIAAHAVPAEFHAVRRFFGLPGEMPSARELEPAARGRYARALRRLVWEWKAPLQREWYPFLYMLETDLLLLAKGRTRGDRAWIRKKYAPALASILIRQ